MIFGNWREWIAQLAGGLVFAAIYGLGLWLVIRPPGPRRGPYGCAVCGKTGRHVVRVPVRRPEYRVGVDPPTTHVWVCSVAHLAHWIDGAGEGR